MTLEGTLAGVEGFGEGFSFKYDASSDKYVITDGTTTYDVTVKVQIQTGITELFGKTFPQWGDYTLVNGTIADAGKYGNFKVTYTVSVNGNELSADGEIQIPVQAE